MEMEADEGTAVKPTTPSTPPPPGPSASSLASETGTSASPTEEGGEGLQVKVPGQEEGKDGGDAAEASDGDDEGADPPSNEEDDEDDGWSTVSEDDSVDEGQAAHDDDMEEDDASLGSSENEDIEDSDTTSDEGNAEDDGDEDDDLDLSDLKVVALPQVWSLLGMWGRCCMKNPVILKNLFKLCPPRLLANFRLVCKDWLDLSLEAWRSSITLHFDHNGRKVQLRVVDIDDDKKYGEIPLKDFLKYVDNPKNQCQLKPFRRYNLTDRFKFPLEENKSLRTRKLWELVKRDATALGLYECSFPKIEVFREVIYKDLPNLQQLQLICCQIGKEEFSEGHRKEPILIGVYPEHLNLMSLSIEMDDNDTMVTLPLEWLELFSQFPSLTRLSFGVSVVDEEPEDQPLVITELLRALEAIKAVRKKDPRKLPLKEFDIFPYFDTSHDHELFGQVFALLLELRLPLKSLKLCMESGKKKKLGMQKLTSEIDGSRFRSLTFYQSGISTWQFPFQAPLENLSELVMWDVIWENMEFLRLVPNLAKLEIVDYISACLGESRGRPVSAAMLSNTHKEGLAYVKLLKMKDFTWGFALTEDDLRHLGNWFPNLTNLQTALNDKLFSIVCEQWWDLESLLVDGAELTDQGVTGLSGGQVVDDLETMELPPNIRLLQKLTYFRCAKSDKVTDVSIFNGFLKLPNLEGLHLGKGFSEKAKAAVKETGKISFTSRN